MTALAAVDRSAAPVDRFPRRLSPTAQPSGSLGRMLGSQARAELRKFLRAPDFVAPVVLLPAVLFALFAGPALDATFPNGLRLGPILTASFTMYGILGIALFTFGEGLATERGQGWLRLVRATPLPGPVFLLGKLAAAIVIMALLVVLMALTATALGAGVDPVAWLRLGPVAILGGIALAPFGSFLGLLVRPSAGGAVSLLLYLPLSFASGMWTPVEQLPEVVQAIAPYLPTYHLAEVAHAAVGVPTPDVAVHVAWLVATFAVASALAAWAYRRVSGRQFA